MNYIRKYNVTLFLILLLSFPIGLLSQPPKIVRKIAYVKKGLCQTDSKNCRKNTDEYIRACSDVGDYYYSLKKFNKAIRFYSIARKINLDGHGKFGLYDMSPAGKAAYLHTYEKSGVMDLKGLGTKPDTLSALYNLTEYIYAFSKEKRSEFSKILFKSDNPVLDTANFSGTDSAMDIFINPFYMDESSLLVSLDKYMQKIYSRLNRENNLICELSLTNAFIASSEWRSNLGIILLRRLQEANKKLIPKFFIVDSKCLNCFVEINGIPVQYLTLTLKRKQQ